MPFFYFSTYETNGLPSPAWTSSWTNMNTAERSRLRFEQFGKTSVVGETKSKVVATNPTNSGIRQFISDPLPNAGTLASGTALTFAAQMTEPDGTFDAMPRIVISIYSKDGSTLRGTAYAGPTNTTVVTSGTANNRELEVQTLVTNAGTSRRIIDTTQTTVAWQRGDRLVVEIGARFVNTLTTSSAAILFTCNETLSKIYPPPGNDTAVTNFLPYLFINNAALTTPALGIEEYQYLAGGRLLNGSNASLPFIDITSVDGVDAVDPRQSSANREGAHGAYITAEFQGPRTITLEGTLYASPSSLEQELDELKANFAPSSLDQPFYFGTDNGSTRMVFGKSLGLRYPKTIERGSGKVNFQIQILCQDPRTYTAGDVTQQVLTGVSNVFTVAGNRDTPLVIKLRSTLGNVANGQIRIRNVMGDYTFQYGGILSATTGNILTIEATLEYREAWQ
jgi:hypothetical protein